MERVGGDGGATAPKLLALRLPFDGNWKLSQPWGANPQNYPDY